MKVDVTPKRSASSIAERAHAERLRGVVARVEHDDSQLARLDRGVMRAFADDQRVESRARRLAQRRRIGAGAGADAPARVTRSRSNGVVTSVSAELARPDRRALSAITRVGMSRRPAQADVDRLVASEPAARLETQAPREQRIVAELRMHVERQMRRVHGDVVRRSVPEDAGDDGR